MDRSRVSPLAAAVSNPRLPYPGLSGREPAAGPGGCSGVSIPNCSRYPKRRAKLAVFRRLQTVPFRSHSKSSTKNRFDREKVRLGRNRSVTPAHRTPGPRPEPPETPFGREASGRPQTNTRAPGTLARPSRLPSRRPTAPAPGIQRHIPLFTLKPGSSRFSQSGSR